MIQILSQDEELLIEPTIVQAIGKTVVANSFTQLYTYTLGEYATHERAKDVVYDILTECDYYMMPKE